MEKVESRSKHDDRFKDFQLTASYVTVDNNTYVKASFTTHDLAQESSAGAVLSIDGIAYIQIQIEKVLWSVIASVMKSEQHL